MAETYTMGFWTAKPGEEDTFAAAWTEFAEWIKKQPGVNTLRLVRDVKDPSKFISFANWNSIELVHVWKATPEFKERIGRVKKHTDEFTAAEAEVVVHVEAFAAVT